MSTKPAAGHIRVFSGLTFYLLLPMTMLLFAWKAAVFSAWGSGLLCVAAGVIASHAMLPLRRVSWRTRSLLSAGVVILAGAAMLGFGPLRRPFYLDRANLSAAFLPGYNLSGADLTGANLTGADLSGADLIGANLSRANLTAARLGRADLTDANLSEAELIHVNLLGTDLFSANLFFAHLSGAYMFHANLMRANLTGTDLSGADLTGESLEGQEQINGACGADAKLPGFTLKPC